MPALHSNPSQETETDMEGGHEKQISYCQDLDEVLEILKKEDSFSHEDEVHTSDEECEFYQSEVHSHVMVARTSKCESVKREITISSSEDEADDAIDVCSKESDVKNCVKSEIDRYADVVVGPETKERKTKARKNSENGKCHKCDVCGKIYSRRYTLKVHMQKHSDTIINHKNNKICVQGPHFCSICEKQFLRLNTLNAHMKIHQIEEGTASGQQTTKLSECRVCKKQFVYEVNMRLHMEIHEGTQKFECDECGAHFSRKSDLKRHLTSHTGEKRFKCTLCPKSFSRSGGLNRHIRWHSGQNDCKYCGKRLVRGIEYRRHVLKHEKELNIDGEMSKLECKVCGDVLRDELNLANHMNASHGATSDPKTFQCVYCDKQFSTASNRARHVQSKHYDVAEFHNNDKRKCPRAQCDLGFSSLSNRAQHVLSEHDCATKSAKFHQEREKQRPSDKPFDCDICGKNFGCLRNMKEHIEKVHFKKGLYTCSICDRHFYKKKELERHLEKTHSNSIVA